MQSSTSCWGERRWRIRKLLLVSATFGIALTESHAQFTDWQQAGAGDWFDPVNWSAGVPGPGFFPQPAIARIDMGTAQVGATGANTYYGLKIGDFSTGALEINSGGTLLSTNNLFFIPADVILGSGIGSSGTATVTGAGSLWTVETVFRVGLEGQAALTISGGGRIASSAAADIGFGSNGTANVLISGAGSEWASSGVMVIGGDGVADVVVNSGGQLTNSAEVFLGNGAGGGDVTVTGTGSRWDSSAEVIVGRAGAATLTVGSGGVADFATGGLVAGEATGAAATITVSGTGTELRSGNLVLGDSGNADLTVDTGAAATSGSVSIADAAGSNSSASVDGVGTSWTTGDLGVGTRGTGSLTASAGGALDSANTAVGDALGANGTLTVGGAGTTWDASGNVRIGGGGTATYSLTTGAVATASGGLTAGADASGNGTANISGGASWTVTGDSVLGGLGTGALAISGAGTASFGGKVEMGTQQGGSGGATVDGFGSAWTTGDLTIGGAGGANVAVTSGGRLTADALQLGELATGTGDLSVTGFGSVLTVDSLVAGGLGDGMVLVGSGANASVSGDVMLGQGLVAFGELKVEGIGTALLTRDLTVGGSGGGRFEVTGGGLANSIGNVEIGGTNGSVGIAEVRDAGSLWQVVGGVTVGDGGDGTLTVRDGGRVRALSGAGVATGIGSSGTLRVAGAGSVFENTGNLDLAFSSSRVANLRVEGGLAYVTESVLIGVSSTVFLSGGELSVDGLTRAAGGSFSWTGGRLTVRGSGGLSIGTTGPLGATVAVDSAAAQYLDVTELITIDPGAQLAFTGSALAAGGIVNDGQISFTGGSFTVGAAGFSNNNLAAFEDVTLGGQYHSPAGSSTSITGTVVFGGQVRGAGQFTGTGLAVVNGQHLPGDSPARVEVAGGFQYGAGASVTFELGGTVPGSGYDVLAVAGDVTLAGTLVVDLIGGFVLAPGMDFVVIEAGGALGGAFDGLAEGATVGNYTGEDLFITYAGGDGNDVALFTAPPPIPEPGVALLVLSALPLALRRRRAAL